MPIFVLFMAKTIMLIIHTKDGDLRFSTPSEDVDNHNYGYYWCQLRIGRHGPVETVTQLEKPQMWIKMLLVLLILAPLPLCVADLFVYLLSGLLSTVRDLKIVCLSIRHTRWGSLSLPVCRPGGLSQQISWLSVGNDSRPCLRDFRGWGGWIDQVVIATLNW